MSFVDTVNENVQESLIHKAVWQSCLVASGHTINGQEVTKAIKLNRVAPIKVCSWPFPLTSV